ncbi:unnamed protein product [Urochloa humidicola]
MGASSSTTASLSPLSATALVVCVSLINGGAKSVSHNKPVGPRSFGAFAGDFFIGFLYLQVLCWRFVFHLLLVGSRCSWVPFVGLLFAGRRLLEMHLTSVSGEGDCLGRSTIQQHCVLPMGSKLEVLSSNRKSVGSVFLELLQQHCVLPMGSKLKVLSSNRKSAGSVFLELLHSERWRSTRMQQQWPETAKGTGYFFNGLHCNFFLSQGYPVRCFDVILLYQ